MRDYKLLCAIVSDEFDMVTRYLLYNIEYHRYENVTYDLVYQLVKEYCDTHINSTRCSSHVTRFSVERINIGILRSIEDYEEEINNERYG